MKRLDLLKYLIKEGCVLIREGTNHSVLFNIKTKRTSTLPRHTEINTFTGKAICRDLGVKIINKK